MGGTPAPPRLAPRLSGRTAEAPDRRSHAPATPFSPMSARCPPAEARAVLHDALALGGIKHVGARTIEEITERFLEQAADASSARLPRATRRPHLAVPRRQSRRRPKRSRLCANSPNRPASRLDAPIGAFERRFGLIERHGFNLARATFAAQFGRNMEYYTGFVFEFRANGDDRARRRRRTLRQSVDRTRRRQTGAGRGPRHLRRAPARRAPRARKRAHERTRLRTALQGPLAGTSARLLGRRRPAPRTNRAAPAITPPRSPASTMSP